MTLGLLATLAAIAIAVVAIVVGLVVARSKRLPARVEPAELAPPAEPAARGAPPAKEAPAERPAPARTPVPSTVQVPTEPAPALPQPVEKPHAVIPSIVRAHTRAELRGGLA